MDIKENHTLIPKLDIDFSKARVPRNYVWIKLDEDFETYHNTDTGEDTGLYVAMYGINQASHVAVTGTIVAVADKLTYNGYETARMKADLLKNKKDQEYIARLRLESVAYDVPIEIGVGHKVYFEYTTRLNALKEGRLFEVGEVRYMAIPYDLLVMAFSPNTDFKAVKISDVYMLNGFVLIKPLEYATASGGDKLPQGVTTENDLFIPTAADAKFVKTGNIWYANVLAVGCAVKGYADFPHRGGEIQDNILKPGVKIAYDGRQQKRLENESHRVIFKSHVLYRIQRKDIFHYYPDGKITA